MLFLCLSTTIEFEVKVREFERCGLQLPMYKRGFSRGKKKYTIKYNKENTKNTNEMKSTKVAEMQPLLNNIITKSNSKVQ